MRCLCGRPRHLRSLCSCGGGGWCRRQRRCWRCWHRHGQGSWSCGHLGACLLGSRGGSCHHAAHAPVCRGLLGWLRGLGCRHRRWLCQGAARGRWLRRPCGCRERCCSWHTIPRRPDAESRDLHAQQPDVHALVDEEHAQQPSASLLCVPAGKLGELSAAACWGAAALQSRWPGQASPGAASDSLWQGSMHSLSWEQRRRACPGLAASLVCVGR